MLRTRPFFISAARGDIRSILAICLAIYALGLPAMLLAATSHQPVAEPRGTKVEQVFPKHDSRWTIAQTHIFNKQEEWQRILIFEGTKQLEPGRYEAKPLGADGWPSIVIRASDDSDPATNGRRYYVVLP